MAKTFLDLGQAAELKRKADAVGLDIQFTAFGIMLGPRLGEVAAPFAKATSFDEAWRFLATFEPRGPLGAER